MATELVLTKTEQARYDAVVNAPVAERHKIDFYFSEMSMTDMLAEVDAFAASMGLARENIRITAEYDRWDETAEVFLLADRVPTEKERDVRVRGVLASIRADRKTAERERKRAAAEQARREKNDRATYERLKKKYENA